jgi:hypothetical protein
VAAWFKVSDLTMRSSGGCEANFTWLLGLLRAAPLNAGVMLEPEAAWSASPREAAPALRGSLILQACSARQAGWVGGW